MKTIPYTTTLCPECGSPYTGIRATEATPVCKLRYHSCRMCRARFRTRQYFDQRTRVTTT